jgi:5-methylcytosine-specific restriction endonuclease McrA
MTASHCAICGEPFTPQDPPTRGHIIALANGGSNDPSNFQAEHRSCNLRKGANADPEPKRASRQW